MELAIQIENQGDFTLLKVEGHLDSNNIHLMENALSNATKLASRQIVIDCANLISINGDGLKLLFQSQVEMAGNYYLSLQNVRDEVADLMEISGVTHFIQMHTQAEQFSA
ncbi:STAS domain-containing protein [Endozoicomonas ascidiicola]|uniref:STAS domain-containing protein n=1 Tax=Endozoicomonas ascidiicola TaxID=1698521 RepID=UPI00082CB433|nr:STAS domain-containing protein [Endozoicomonas ascidiicola]